MISIQKLSFAYHYRDLFQDVSFELKPGTALQVIGPNGCGKTTLLRMIAGFIEPDCGTITWCGQSIFHLKEEYQKNIQYVGHKNAVLLKQSVLDNLQFYAALHGTLLPTSTLSAIAERIGLNQHFTKLACHLSAGMQRRLSLAQLLLQRKSLWILDEPLTALDQTAQALWRHLFDEHCAQGGMILLTSHQTIDLSHKIILELGHA